MNPIDAKRAEFHRYLEACGVVDALSQALIKLYEEPEKPVDPVKFVSFHMGQHRQMAEDSERQNIIGENEIEKDKEDKSSESEALYDGDENNKITENLETGSEKECIEKNIESQENVEDGLNLENFGGMENTQIVENDTTNTRTTDSEGTPDSTDFNQMQSNEDCIALLKKYLNADLFDQLRTKETELNHFQLVDCIKSGLENLDSLIGIYAKDIECYKTFAEIFNPIIGELHSGFPTANECDWGDPDEFSEFNEAFSMYMTGAIKFSCHRSIKDYPFVCGMSSDQLLEVHTMIRTTVESFDEHLQGQFIEVVEDETEIENGEFLFSKSNKFHESADIYIHWPSGRSVFVNATKTMVIWINEEDHLKFTATGTKFGETYKCLIDYLTTLKDLFMYDTQLGWPTTCPLNLGTAFIATAELKLVKLPKTEKFYTILDTFNIHLNATNDDVVTIDTSKQKFIGKTEFEITKSLYDCMIELMSSESEIED